MARRSTLTVLAFLLLAAASVRDLRATHTCIPERIGCGETRNARLDATECFVDEVSYADFFTFEGAEGQSVTITLHSDDFTPTLLLFSPTPDLVSTVNGAGDEAKITTTLTRTGEWRIAARTTLPRETGGYSVSLACSTVTPPAGPWLTTGELPGFRFKVRISAGSRVHTGTKVADCIEDALCVSGAVRDRPEVFLRVVGPRPNGFLWPTVVKLTPSQVEAWVEQLSTGKVNYYLLPGAAFDDSELPGFFDRFGFEP
jgi:hypothetical protein